MAFECLFGAMIPEMGKWDGCGPESAESGLRGVQLQRNEGLMGTAGAIGVVDCGTPWVYSLISAFAVGPRVNTQPRP